MKNLNITQLQEKLDSTNNEWIFLNKKLETEKNEFLIEAIKLKKELLFIEINKYSSRIFELQLFQSKISTPEGLTEFINNLSK